MASTGRNDEVPAVTDGCACSTSWSNVVPERGQATMKIGRSDPVEPVGLCAPAAKRRKYIDRHVTTPKQVVSAANHPHSAWNNASNYRITVRWRTLCNKKWTISHPSASGCATAYLRRSDDGAPSNRCRRAKRTT